MTTARRPSPFGRGLAVPVTLLIVYAAFAPHGSREQSRPRSQRPSPAASHATRAQAPPSPAPSLAASTQAALPSPAALPCGEGMLLVRGNYCPEVGHVCARWLDPEGAAYARCAEYARPARCTAPRTPLEFCIDRREYTKPGETLPLNQASFDIAKRICKSQDKRLCTESEWNFACEGEEMRPYPYGWERRKVCNQDRTDLYVPDKRRQVLADRRWPSGSSPDCKSPFGVFDMVGNLDEPVVKVPAGAPPFSNALKGGWWMPARNRCRPATTAHDDHFTDIQIGVRCCSDYPRSRSP